MVDSRKGFTQTEHTVYRRTLQINKEAFSSDCKEQLEKGELQYNPPKSSVKFPKQTVSHF